MMIAPTSQLLARVAALYEDALTEASGPLADRLAAGRARLAEPLRIAIAGRVSTGKSTLVNALLGLPVAPTAAGECTKVVAWFRFGERDAAEIVVKGGGRLPVALQADRALPRTLDVSVDQVDHLAVELYHEPLEQQVIIDTPGLEGASESTGALSTERLLAVTSAAAAAQADALIYLINGELREDDAEVLAAFRQQSAGIGATAVNAVAILNKADKLVESGEGLEPADRRADAIASQLGLAVAGVVPLVGLLAESVSAGRVTEARARRLAVIAAQRDATLEPQLRSVRRFVSAADEELDAQARQDLLRVFDLFGVRAAVGCIRRGAKGAVALSEELERLSGIGDLRDLLETRFGARAEVLKAAAGLRELRVLAASSGDGGAAIARRLRDASDELALQPEMQLVREIDVLRAVDAREVALPDELAEDLRRVTAGDDALVRLALVPGDRSSDPQRVGATRAARWRAWGNDTRRRPAERHAAHVIGMSYLGILRELRGGPR